MNTPTDLTLNGSSLISAVPSVHVIRVRRPLVGKRRHVNVEVPGRAGSWLFPEEPGDRVIVAELAIVADSFEERRAAVVNLAAWADLGVSSRLVISDEPARFHDVILDNNNDPDEWLTAAEIDVAFLAGPYSLATATTEEILALGTIPASGSFAVDDEVNALPIVEITPTNGTLTAFTFTVNGYAIAWAGTLLDDATLTISSLSDTVTVGPNDDVNLTGAFDPADLDMADVSGEFPLLFPGSNPWSFTGSGTATTATIRLLWRERFR